MEWRFKLSALSKRPAAARNLAETSNFASPRTTAPTFTPVLDPGPHVTAPPRSWRAQGCGRLRQERHGDAFWADLRDVARRAGWDIYG
ncbi:MAG: hypothetical protein NVSMB55_22560 [Mycobacteriales bacterium]